MSSELPAPTDRLRFRTYEPNDLANVIEMFDDDEAKRWYPGQSEPDQAQQWIEWNLGSYKEHGVGLWVILDAESGRFLGDCGLTHQEVEGVQLLEIGYHLQSTNRGNGYATEAARQCMDFAFRELDAVTVCSIVDPGNESSLRVAGAVHASRRTFVNARGNTRALFWTDRS